MRRDARATSSRGLEPADESREVALYHASPRDPIWEYVLWPDQAAECMPRPGRAGQPVGHSHVALFFALADRTGAARPRGRPRRPGGRRHRASTSAAGRWLINPGSVGQPRDGDPRAAWLELDTEAWHATFHRVAYDIDRAADAIVATDLPEHLAGASTSGQ